MTCAIGALALMSSQVQSQPVIRSLRGAPGLIDMPSARMAADGELLANVSYFHNNQRYNLGFQATPWLETSFRYSGLGHFNTVASGYSTYFDRSFAMKLRLWEEDGFYPALAVGVNDLVGTGIYGSEYIVASKQLGDFDFTLGFGWGRLGTANSFRNPLTLLSKSFENRNTDYGFGGSFNFGGYLHGPKTGVFGGATWQTPIEDLSLVLEYSSDAYVNEASQGNFQPRSQLSVGASYQVSRTMNIGVAWLQNSALAASLTFSLDPTTTHAARLGPVATPVETRSEEAQVAAIRQMLGRRNESYTLGSAARSVQLVDALWRQLPGLQDISVNGTTLTVRADRPSPQLCTSTARLVAAYSGSIRVVEMGNGISCQVAGGAPAMNDALLPIVYTNTGGLTPGNFVTIDASRTNRTSASGLKIAEGVIRREAAAQMINVTAISLAPPTASVYYANSTYLSEAEVVDRLLRILMKDAPPEVEQFQLVALEEQLPAAQFTILRSVAERGFEQEGEYKLFGNGSGPAPVPMDNPVLRQSWRGAFPKFSWSISPQVRQQLFDPQNPFAVQALINTRGSVELIPGLSLNAQADFDLYNNFNVNRPSDSVLPHVRTDFARYFLNGKNGIGSLEASYSFRLAPTIFAKLRGGYLESMFAGVGGEILWRPENRRWALGADLYEVQQRKFDRLLGLQPYRQTTGHITLYYDSPWYDLNFQLRAGRYLAGDNGLTLQVTRRFASGVEIGAFATKTNVSSTQFGEGSFDKGILIRIPVAWTLPIQTQSQIAMYLRPIQRDGGQTLSGDAMLYEVLRSTSEGEMRRQTGD